MRCCLAEARSASHPVAPCCAARGQPAGANPAWLLCAKTKLRFTSSRHWKPHIYSTADAEERRILQPENSAFAGGCSLPVYPAQAARRAPTEILTGRFRRNKRKRKGNTLSTRRILTRRRLKPESVAEYIRLHDNLPPELAHAYRQAGFVRMSTFLCGNDLVFFGEVDAEVYAREQTALERNPLEKRW